MKKILLIIGGYSVDYLADMVWISFITNKNFSCESNIYPSYFFSKKNLHISWGKGFTLYGKLNPKFIDSSPSSEEIRFLIKSNYYDFIVYPSIRRFDRYLGLASKLMGKNRIIAIDGEDDKNISWHARYTTYFKRELTNKAYEKGIKPISFFLPENVLKDINSKLNHESNKKYFLSPCDPREKATYVYEDEKSYYQQYKDSYFGFTMMKGGWDCLRHYEIIASGSLPYFSNLENIPIYTLKSYPRDLQRKANELFIAYSNKNSIDNNFINNYKQLQSEFRKWMNYSSSNFGSKELKMHIQNDFNNEICPNIKICSLIITNIFGFIEYTKERKNNKNKMEIFINFFQFILRNLFFYLTYRFIRAKK